MRSKAQAVLFETAPAKHDAGGKVRIPVNPTWKCDAIFSPCERYRYELSRIWNDVQSPRLAFWLLQNPSVATIQITDPTVAKTCRMSQSWGYDGVLIGNIEPHRATDKRNLPPFPVQDVSREQNKAHLVSMAIRASIIIVGHGQFHTREYRAQAAETCIFLRTFGFALYVLDLAKTGEPKHPLFLSEKLKPIPWEPIP